MLIFIFFIGGESVFFIFSFYRIVFLFWVFMPFHIYELFFFPLSLSTKSNKKREMKFFPFHYLSYQIIKNNLIIFYSFSCLLLVFFLFSFPSLSFINLTTHLVSPWMRTNRWKESILLCFSFMFHLFHFYINI